MKPLPTILTVIITVAIGALLLELYRMLVLPLQSLGIFLIVAGLGVAIVAKRFDRLLSLRRGAFSLRRSPLFVSVVLVATGVGILLFGAASLLILGALVWWRVKGLERSQRHFQRTSLSRAKSKKPAINRVRG